MRSRRIALWAAALVAYAFLYVPLAIVVVYSFNDSRLNAEWVGFTLDWYRRLAENEEMIAAAGNSLAIALVASLVSTVLGTMAGVAMHRYRMVVLPILVLTPIAIPEILMGVALLIFFVMLNFSLGLVSVALAHIAFCIGFVAIVVRARLAGMDESLIEAARDCGAAPWQAFVHVTLPLIMPGVVAGALMAFTLSIDDFVITFFTAGAGTVTLPLQIYSMVRTGVTPEINAISTILLVATFVLVLLSQRYESGAAGRGTSAVAAAVVIALGVFSIGGPVRDAGKRELSVYIWSQYLPDELVAEFEARYGVRVNVELYDSNEAMLAKLQTGVASYDIVVPSDYMIEILRQNDLLEEIEQPEYPQPTDDIEVPSMDLTPESAT